MSEIRSVGIVGDGPEANELAAAAKSLGLDVAMFCRADLVSPALRPDVEQYDSSSGDATAVDAFVAVSDVITYAGSCPNVLTMGDFEERGTPILPEPFDLAVSQDSLQLKEHLVRQKIHTLSCMRIQTETELELAEATYRNTLIFKAGLAAEDTGQPNLEVTGDTDWEEIADYFGIANGRNIMLCAEPKASIVREFLVMGSRHASGRIALYPVVEIVRHETVGKLMRLPPDPNIDPATLMDAAMIGEEVIESFATQGLFAVTMLEDPSRKLWVNKVLPHAHPLGNFTADATLTPQYVQQIRAVTGMEPGPTDMIPKAAVTVNIPGGTAMQSSPPEVLVDLASPDVRIAWHRYDVPAGRCLDKAGHVTVLGAHALDAELLAVAAYKLAVR